MQFLSKTIQKYPEKISVIMPAYNEAGSIVHNIRETKSTIEKIFSHYEIIIADDGSSDDTFKRVKDTFKKDPFVIVRGTKNNYGKGRALKHGFKFATGDLTVFLDADLDLHPSQVEILYNVMADTKSDIVIGSKRHPASVLNYPKRRQAASYLFNFIVRCLFLTKIKDTQTGIKLFKTPVLTDLFSRSLVQRYAFDVELLMIAHHLGYLIQDAPITLSFTREHRLGRMKIMDFLHTVSETLFIFYNMYIKRTYLRSKPKASQGGRTWKK